MELVSRKEKFSYGLGSLGMNLIFNTMSTYLMIFYTDVFGINASVIRLLFLIAKIWDAVNDPIMGSIADRTMTRYGKYRPYILFAPFAVAVFVVLCFSAPLLAPVWKIVYIYFTYILFGMSYTTYDIPFWSLAPTLTHDVNESTKIVAIPRIMGVIGTLAAGVAIIPMVKAIGKGNDAIGYQVTLIILVAITVALNIVTFINVKERIKDETKKHEPLKVSLQVIFKNKPLLLVLAAGLLGLIPLFIKFSLATYYFKYNAGDEGLTTIFMLSTSVLMIVGMLVTSALSKKTGKRNSFIAAGLISAIGSILMFSAGSSNLVLFTRRLRTVG